MLQTIVRYCHIKLSQDHNMAKLCREHQSHPEFKFAVAKIQDRWKDERRVAEQGSVTILAYRMPPNFLNNSNLRYALLALEKISF